MNGEWSFWRAQLAGRNPETTPGTPHAGYYELRRWISDPSRPGKRKVHMVPVALWQEAGEWLAIIGYGDVRRLDLYDADNLFASCCRNAISYEDYTNEVYGNDRGE